MKMALYRKTKIINTDERNTEGNKYKVKSLMPDKFEILSEEYCSLGQSQEYYDNIKIYLQMEVSLSSGH